MKKSKFMIMDRVSRQWQEFIPKQKTDLFSEKIPTYQQFFNDIKGLGNIKIAFNNRVIAIR